MAAEAWPSSRCTAVTLAPEDTARLAAVCRSSCGVSPGKAGLGSGPVEDPLSEVADTHDAALRSREQKLAGLPAGHCLGEVVHQRPRDGDGPAVVGLGRAEDRDQR